MVLKYNGLSLLKMTVFVNVGRKQMIIWVEQLQQLTVLHVCSDMHVHMFSHLPSQVALYFELMTLGKIKQQKSRMILYTVKPGRIFVTPSFMTK